MIFFYFSDCFDPNLPRSLNGVWYMFSIVSRIILSKIRWISRFSAPSILIFLILFIFLDALFISFGALFLSRFIGFILFCAFLFTRFLLVSVLSWHLRWHCSYLYLPFLKKKLKKIFFGLFSFRYQPKSNSKSKHDVFKQGSNK